MVVTNNPKGGEEKLSIYTFNARGLRDHNKRRRVFTHFKNNYDGIICLQETYSLPGDEIIWAKDWNGEILLSHGTQHSRGVAILIPKKYNTITKQTKVDDKGRYAFIECKIKNLEIAILNVYAPTSDKVLEQCTFLDDILPIINEYYNKLLLLGDMNTHLSELDKQSNVRKLTTFGDRVNAMLEEYNLCDTWRIKNPELKRFTWRKCTYKGILQSRIDYIFAPLNFMYHILDSKINPSVYSDHSIVQLTLSTWEQKNPGRGYWKLNTLLLKDIEYVTAINALIDECETTYSNMSNKGLLWDVVKMRIRSHTISHAAHKAKLNRQHEKELISELQNLEDTVSCHPTEEAKQRLITAKNELEQLNNERTRGHQIRARCMYVELNERSNSYFLNKEIAAAQTKCISALELDNGTVVTEPKEILEHQQQFYKELYTQKEQDQKNDIDEANSYFLTNDSPHIDDNERQLLDAPIAYEEITSAIKALPSKKSPGSDGFPIEFY
jgi:exonuclease III